MPPEGLLLGGTTRLIGAEEVHAGFTDRHDARISGQIGDLRPCPFQRRHALVGRDAGRLVGVQRHGSGDLRPVVCQTHGHA